MKFRAIIDFYSPEMQSEYVTELLYTARTEPLMSLIHKWAEERKIELVDPAIVGSGLSGKGTTEWL